MEIASTYINIQREAMINACWNNYQVASLNLNAYPPILSAMFN